jgi:hypothetical protein
VSRSVGHSAMSDTATHVFRVELRPDLYREIEVLSRMPLDYLAAAIVEVFGFDFDHLYRFYSKLTGNVYASTPRYEVPGMLDDPDALSVEKVAIEEAFRRVGKVLSAFGASCAADRHLTTRSCIRRRRSGPAAQLRAERGWSGGRRVRPSG